MKEKPSADTISRLRDFTQRLEVSGGDLLATGLPVTKFERCPRCRWPSTYRGAPPCSQCFRIGVVRVRSVGQGN